MALNLPVGLGGAILLALDIFAVFSILASKAAWPSKVFWLFVVLLLPIVGFVLWFLFGPTRSSVNI